MKAWFKGFVVSLGISGLLFFSTVYLDDQGFFNLIELKVKFVDSDQAGKFPAMQRWKQDLKSEFSNLKGTSLWDLPISDIASRLAPLDWLENYSLHRRFPNQLSIELRPKHWIALVQTGSSREFRGLSSSCSLLPGIRLIDSIDLPVVLEKDLQKTGAQEKVCEFLNLIDEDSALISENISRLSWGSEGLQIHMIEPSVRLSLGSEQLNTRIRRVEKVLRHLEIQSLTPRVITASFGQKVVVKLRKAR